MSILACDCMSFKERFADAKSLNFIGQFCASQVGSHAHRNGPTYILILFQNQFPRGPLVSCLPPRSSFVNFIACAKIPNEGEFV